MEIYKSNRLILLLLRRAIGQNNIIPYFQPICSTRTNEITRYESLVRLIDGIDVVSPASFLDISRRAKIYPQITQIMVKKTFAYFSSNNLEFSLNLGRDDFFNRETVNLIYLELERINDPSRVIFELLETEKIEDCEGVHSFISHVKKMGCRIAVDDFGSGYSNFNYLLTLNVDIIKIDASLIKNIDHDYSSQAITKSIIEFAREMNIKTIAEYVHSQDVFYTVCQLGIDYAQGYFIGKPEPELCRETSVTS